MKVLIVEDDQQLNTAIAEFFSLKNFDTISVTDGLKAIQEIDSQIFDLYIIDINIPEVNGLEILQYIRKTDLYTPIIIITASLEIENISYAYDNGCSEYIKKPFHLKELDIRVNNLLSIQNRDRIIITDELYYDLNNEEFLYKQNTITLTFKEKRICTLMIKNINTYVSYEKFYDYVWEGTNKEYFPLRQLVSKIRKKLPHNIIKSKNKLGYIIQTYEQNLDKECL